MRISIQESKTVISNLVWGFAHLYRFGTEKGTNAKIEKIKIELLKDIKQVASSEPMWAAVTRSSPKKSFKKKDEPLTSLQTAKKPSALSPDHHVLGTKSDKANSKVKVYKSVISSLASGFTSLYKCLTENGANSELTKIQSKVFKAVEPLLAAEPTWAAMMGWRTLKNTSDAKNNISPKVYPSNMEEVGADSFKLVKPKALKFFQDKIRKQDEQNISQPSFNPSKTKEVVAAVDSVGSTEAAEEIKRTTARVLLVSAATTESYNSVRAKALKFFQDKIRKQDEQNVSQPSFNPSKTKEVGAAGDSVGSTEATEEIKRTAARVLLVSAATTESYNSVQAEALKFLQRDICNHQPLK